MHATISKEFGGQVTTDEALKAKMQEQVEKSAMAASMAPRTNLTVEPLAPDADVQVARDEILKAEGHEKTSRGENPRLALIVVKPDAVMLQPGQEKFGSYDYFVAPKLDVEVQGDIQSQVKTSPR